jgi:hypothetical protein
LRGNSKPAWVWASGKTFKECRYKFAEVLDGWILIKLSRGLETPEINGKCITISQEIRVA